MSYMALIEAVASTAMSHKDGCRCDVCLAADGDKEAMGRVMSGVLTLREQLDGL